MPTSLRGRSILRLLGLVSGLALCLTGACAPYRSGQGLQLREGPYLRPGPAGKGGIAVVADPGFAASAGPGRAAGVPAGLTSGQGMGRLPGARIPGIGPVAALVIPVSLGSETPSYTEVELGQGLFGAPSQGETSLAWTLGAASEEGLRFSATVLPLLNDPERRLATAPDPQALLRLAREALEIWGRETDLGSHDNDGPDGIPSSGDDDGAVDLFFLSVECDHPFPSVTLRVDLTVRSAGRVLRVGPVHVVSVARGGVVQPRSAIGLVLDAAGLDPGERFFPASFPRAVSSLARVRLGWRAAEAGPQGGRHVLPADRVWLYPVTDMPPGTGFWMLERDGGELYVSRAVRKMDGHYQLTDAFHWQPGAEQLLPLTRQLGARGPQVRVRWSVGGEPLVETVAPSAVAGWHDQPRRLEEGPPAGDVGGSGGGMRPYRRPGTEAGAGRGYAAASPD